MTLHLIALALFHPIRTAVAYTTAVCAPVAVLIWAYTAEERT